MTLWSTWQRWHVAMRLDGADRRVGGAVRATMGMDLVEASPQETELVITSDISFLGKLVELGPAWFSNPSCYDGE